MLMSNDTYQFERAKAWQHAIRKREKNCTYVSQKKKQHQKQTAKEKNRMLSKRADLYLALQTSHIVILSKKEDQN